ncbi:hypothetical protein [uncultured Tateyamaria sp.]|uniref:hypothetical protein n=1 Tax=uncultured Tateyamaria sp. TaxID=455651 RepID=UPI0026034AC2|nr:hypothetical protein [uncultured Tateyamaria sp.]
MALYEYLWDDRANCLLVYVDAPEDIDVVTVEHLQDGEFRTIGVGIPGVSGQGGFEIFAVALPEDAGIAPVMLTVSGVKSAKSSGGPRPTELIERITLDAHANFDKADRKHWIVEYANDTPMINILDADEKVPTSTISSVLASTRHGQTIGPAQNSSGEGQGGTLRARIFQDESGEHGALEVEIVAADDELLPETQVSFYTLSAVDHVLPALKSGRMDLETLNNADIAVFGGVRNGTRQHVFQTPSDSNDENSKHIAFLDRIAIATRPPSRFIFERSATQSHPIGKKGAMMIVNGKDDFPYVDDGALLDVFLDAQPAITTASNMDFVRAFADAGKPMQPDDLDFANELTAAVYSELAHLIADTHQSNAAHLAPAGINQFLSAPTYFGMLAALDPARMPTFGPRRLASELARGTETEVLQYLASIVLQTEAKDQPRIKLWLDSIDASQSAFRAITLPFHEQSLTAIAAGIDASHIELGQVDQLSDLVDISMRRQILDVLTAAEVLPVEYAAQFISAASDDIGEDASAVHELVDETLDFCQRAFDASGLHRGGALETRDLFALAQVTVPKRAARTVVDTAQTSLLVKLTESLAGETISLWEYPVDALLNRIATFLYERFKADFDRIQSIVRSANLVDPLQGTPGTVVQFSPNQTASLHDEAPGFRRRPSHDEMAWLSAIDGDPVLIAECKADLLRQLDVA